MTEFYKLLLPVVDDLADFDLRKWIFPDESRGQFDPAGLLGFFRLPGVVWFPPVAT